MLVCVCTCICSLHQESSDMILATNPSYQMGLSHHLQMQCQCECKLEHTSHEAYVTDSIDRSHIGSWDIKIPRLITLNDQSRCRPTCMHIVFI
jgi:hypothetical protein